MSLEGILEKIGNARKKIKRGVAGTLIAIGLACLAGTGCDHKWEEISNPSPIVYTYLEAEARTDRSTPVTAVVYDSDISSVQLCYAIGAVPEQCVPMANYWGNEFEAVIPRPNIDRYFLENPADWIYYRVLAYDSAGVTSDPPWGHYYAKLYASEYHGRDAIWFVLDSAQMDGFFYPMTYISEDVWSQLYASSGSFEAEVDVMDHYIDWIWYSPYFGFEYMIDGDYESARVPVDGSGYTPSETNFIRNSLMSPPSIGPPAVWLIDKGTIREVEDAAWDGLFFARFIAAPPYY